MEGKVVYGVTLDAVDPEALLEPSAGLGISIEDVERTGWR